jgi:D-inositol-3-phosphate glycosyltransferase
MKNVIFLSPHSDPEAHLGEVDSGGQCIYEYELARALSLNFDMRVTIYCRKKHDHPRMSVVNDKFIIKRIICGGSEDFIAKERLDPHLDEFAQKVALDLKTENADVIHAHYWDGGKVAILVHKYLFREIPIIWTPHSLGSAKRRNFRSVEDEIEYNFVRRVAWESYSMLSSNAIVVSTEHEKGLILGGYGIEESKVRVIPPGIPIDKFDRVSKRFARKKLNLPNNKGVMMSLGRLDRRKGYHNAIKVMAEFRRLFSFDAILVIFAGVGTEFTPEEQRYKHDLEQLAERLGVRDFVIFRDAVAFDEVRYVYAASDLYLCLSEYEPFGLTVLESMYMKTPVISTNVGGPVNLIDHNKTGMLVDAHNYIDCAYKAYSLMRDQNLRGQIIEHARRFVSRYFTWASRARDFAYLYNELNGKEFDEKQRRLLNHVSAVSL